MKKSGTIVVAIALFCLLSCPLTAKEDGYKTLDYPGAAGGSIIQINSSGQMIGLYTDGDGNEKGGFITTGSHHFTSVSVPSSVWTFPSSISNSGMVSGTSNSSGGFFFVRSAAGDYSTFNIPGGFVSTGEPQIDDAGDVAGTYQDATYKIRGYFRSASGKFSNIDVPGASETTIAGINANGEVAGGFNDGLPGGFTMMPSGSFVEFRVPKSPGSISVNAIGDDGAVAGTYMDQNGKQRCFLRNKKGRFSSFAVQDGTYFYPQSVGPNDEIVGYYYRAADKKYLGLIIKSDGTSIDLYGPKGANTYLKSINADKLVGYYTSKRYYAITHGFVLDEVQTQ